MNRRLLLMTVAVVVTAGCAQPRHLPEQAEADAATTLDLVREFPDQRPTGLALTADGRLFVNFPRWSHEHGDSVVVISPDGTVSPYPDTTWNTWEGNEPGRHFICVQSVWAEPQGDLWVLDPGSPLLQGVVPGGAKLVRIDTTTDQIERIYILDDEAAPRQSYLNDVRVDATSGTAYITDSGLGALVVLDLASGKARRVLGNTAGLRADPGLVPVIGGHELRGPSGDVPQIHADGIALDLGRGRLFLHALTAAHLYAIDTALILDPSVDEDRLAGYLSDLGPTVVCDGMIAGRDGDVYMTALEQDAIVVRHRDGSLETVVSDPRIAWPDSLAWGPDGNLYFTTSQIHLQPAFGGERTEPYRVFRVAIGR